MELSLWHQEETDNIKILLLKRITVLHESLRTLRLRYRSKKGSKLYMPPSKQATEKVVKCKDFEEKSSAIFDRIDPFVMKNEIKEKPLLR